MEHFRKTGVGATVNTLSKFNGEIGVRAKSLVTKRNAMVVAEGESIETTATPSKTDANAETTEGNDGPNGSINERHDKNYSRHENKSTDKREGNHKNNNTINKNRSPCTSTSSTYQQNNENNLEIRENIRKKNREKETNKESSHKTDNEFKSPPSKKPKTSRTESKNGNNREEREDDGFHSSMAANIGQLPNMSGSALILYIIQHYERSIVNSQDNEPRLLQCIYQLHKLPIKMEHLQKTELAATVNSLSKLNGEIGVIAKSLVTKWNAMVVAEGESIETTATPSKIVIDAETTEGNDGPNGSIDERHDKNYSRHENKSTDKREGNHKNNNTINKNRSPCTSTSSTYQQNNENNLEIRENIRKKNREEETNKKSSQKTDNEFKSPPSKKPKTSRTESKNGNNREEREDDGFHSSMAANIGQLPNMSGSALILYIIQHYERSIVNSQDNEPRLLQCIYQLHKLPIKKEHLQKTELATTVNSLSKLNGEIGVIAKSLVTKWNAMVVAEGESIETTATPSKIVIDAETTEGNDGPNGSIDERHDKNYSRHENKSTDKREGNHKNNNTINKNRSPCTSTSSTYQQNNENNLEIRENIRKKNREEETNKESSHKTDNEFKSQPSKKPKTSRTESKNGNNREEREDDGFHSSMAANIGQLPNMSGSALILYIIQHYERSIVNSQDNEPRLLQCIYQLHKLPIKKEHLQKTELAATVNSLSKLNGEIGVIAKSLVTKWNAMVVAEGESIETTVTPSKIVVDAETTEGNDGPNKSIDERHDKNYGRHEYKSTDEREENHKNNNTNNKNRSPCTSTSSSAKFEDVCLKVVSAIRDNAQVASAKNFSIYT